MKLIKVVPALIIAIIFCSTLVAQINTTITNPAQNSLIKERENFPVSWSIANFEQEIKKWHYWISIADVKNKIPNLHWPKFYVKEAQGTDSIYDGGRNPFPTPQPMLILLLRVDDAANQRFIGWLEKGAPYKGFPVNPEEIVHQVPIKFP